MAALSILYLVHDLCDPAVHRRVAMFEAGGAKLCVAGFRRHKELISKIGNAKVIDLGITRNGQFGHRIVSVMRAALTITKKIGDRAQFDIVVARNLEMLALANRVTGGGRAVPLVYECLDIHRLMLRDDIVGKSLRRMEGLLAANARLLMTSSPGFVQHYFKPLSHVSAPVDLIENKVLELASSSSNLSPPSIKPPNDPLRIGWFGALRCARSLSLLAQFTRAMEGRFKIILRGMPALDVLPDFHDFVEAEPHLSFHGRYGSDELAKIYGDVDFSWAIDFFEQGQNSKWLLPNRLYEGCRFGAVPICMEGTQTAHFCRENGIGLKLKHPTVEALSATIGALEPAFLTAHKRAVLEKDQNTWSWDKEGCQALVSMLGDLSFRPPLNEQIRRENPVSPDDGRRSRIA